MLAFGRSLLAKACRFVNALRQQQPSLPHDLVIRDPLHAPTTQTPLDCSSKLRSVLPEFICRFLVQRVSRVGLQEEVLEPDHDRVEVQDGLPVFAEDVEADVAFEVDVGMVDLW